MTAKHGGSREAEFLDSAAVVGMGPATLPRGTPVCGFLSADAPSGVDMRPSREAESFDSERHASLWVLKHVRPFRGGPRPSHKNMI